MPLHAPLSQPFTQQTNLFIYNLTYKREVGALELLLRSIGEENSELLVQPAETVVSFPPRARGDELLCYCRGCCES